MDRIKPIGSYQSVQEFVSAFVKGETVLDVGCVEHSATGERDERWLHRHIRRSAARVVGLDCLESAVEELNRRGYEIVCGDAMTIDIGERFDVVVAGEIIEHVENPGELIRNLKRHLKPGGRLLLTTPNVFFCLHFLESLWLSPYARWNWEHVSWYCYFTLGNMLERCGMRPVECRYITRSRALLRILRTLKTGCPGPLSSTVVVIAASRDGE